MKPVSILCLFTTASIAIAEGVYAEANVPMRDVQTEPADELLGEYQFEGDGLE